MVLRAGSTSSTKTTYEGVVGNLKTKDYSPTYSRVAGSRRAFYFAGTFLRIPTFSPSLRLTPDIAVICTLTILRLYTCQTPEEKILSFAVIPTHAGHPFSNMCTGAYFAARWLASRTLTHTPPCTVTETHTVSS
jgi:hypothetical protein